MAAERDVTMNGPGFAKSSFPSGGMGEGGGGNKTVENKTTTGNTRSATVHKPK